jgi:hypothetical protein
MQSNQAKDQSTHAYTYISIHEFSTVQYSSVLSDGVRMEMHGADSTRGKLSHTHPTIATLRCSYDSINVQPSNCAFFEATTLPEGRVEMD